MEIIKPTLVQPSYFPVYPQYKNPAAGQFPYQILFYATGLLALVVGLLGLGATIITLKQLFENHENITTHDWLFFGTAAVVFVWKVVTEATALLLVGLNSTKSLKDLSSYFGISMAVGIVIDMFVVAMVLLVLLTASHEFNELVKSLLLMVLAYTLVYFVLYGVSMLALLRYINDLPNQYKSIAESDYDFPNFQ